MPATPPPIPTPAIATPTVVVSISFKALTTNEPSFMFTVSTSAERLFTTVFTLAIALTAAPSPAPEPIKRTPLRFILSYAKTVAFPCITSVFFSKALVELTITFVIDVTPTEAVADPATPANTS